MNVIELTRPAVEPVTLSEVYDHLRLDPYGGTHPHSTMLESMIVSARQDAERITGLAFVERTVRQVMSSFWEHQELARSPYLGALAITYYDTNNAIQTLNASNYLVIEDTAVPRVMLSPTGSWPSTYPRPDAVRYEYAVGYPPVGSPGDVAGNVPSVVKDAIKLKVQMLYDEITPEKRQALQSLYEGLLSAVRVYRT